MSMQPPRALGRCFVLGFSIFLLLTLLYGFIDRGYASLFRSSNNILFTSFWFWPDGRVYFLDLHSDDQASQIAEIVERDAFRHQLSFDVPQFLEGYDPLGFDGIKDTLMVLTNRRMPGSIGRLRASSRLGYWPAAMLIALVIATPLPWSRRGWGLLWGLLLIHAFIVLRVTLFLAGSGYADSGKPWALFHPGALGLRVLRGAEHLLVDNPTVSFVVPVVIWFLVALRYVERPDRADLKEQGDSHQSRPPH
jgi:hypothetical protein